MLYLLHYTCNQTAARGKAIVYDYDANIKILQQQYALQRYLNALSYRTVYFIIRFVKQVNFTKEQLNINYILFSSLSQIQLIAASSRVTFRLQSLEQPCRIAVISITINRDGFIAVRTAQGRRALM